MKPIAHTAKPAAAPKTGRFATLRGPHRAEGSGAPTRGLIGTAVPFIVRSLIAVCALCALLALSAGVARAEVPKLISNGSFVVNELSLGVAVDQSTNDVFVSGLLETSTFGPAHVDKFDASGEPLSPSSFGGAFYSGVAVNPVNRDVDVLGEASIGGPTAIETYDPNSGALLSSFSVPRSGNLDGAFTAVQIATDAAGNVYVPVAPGNEVLEYSPTGTLLETFTGSGAHALSGPTGVAVAPSGDVWFADNGGNRIEEFSPAGAFLSEFASEGVRALALDAHGDVLAIVENSADGCGTLPPPCAHLVEYSSAGAQLADLGAGEIGKPEGRLTSMLAVDEASGHVYVTDGGKSRVLVFQPPLAPVLGQESSVEVGTSEAKLGALVNPGGVETTYRFEYLTEAAFQANKESFSGPEEPVSVPFPEGSVGEGFSARTVWASANGLAPGTTYHYRAVVTNGLGTVVGPDQSFTTQTAAQAACPNEQLRVGFSAALPDCRAYELVTPASKASAQPDTGHLGSARGNYIADDGNRYAYTSLEVMPGSQSAGLEDLATRGASGWSTQDALPLEPYTGDRCPYYPSTYVLTYSADLSTAVLVDNSSNNDSFRYECQAELQEVVPGEPAGTENLLLSNNETGAYQLINLTPPGVTPTDASLVAASANLSLVVFSERAKLTPEALNNTVNTYEWREGVVHLLKFALPSGAPVAGSLVGFSGDGSEMFFTADGNLYVRLNDGERTVQLDEKAPGGSGPGGGGSFAGVTADGSQVFFSDDASAGLTSNTVSGSGTNLYRYDIDTGQLSDLTPFSDANATFQGIGEDGSYLYFDSPAVPTGAAANQFGEMAESGKSNLYVDHGRAITFVKHAGGGVMSSNGAFVAFGSSIYSAASNRFEGAPSGGRVSDNGQVFFATAEALLPRDTNGQEDVYEWDFYSGLHLISSGTGSSESLLLSSTPSGNDVFFLTRQKLVPQDNSQEANKIYDARVDGGFPEPAVPPACTTADACRAAPEPQPLFPSAGVGTAAVFGEDNLSAPPPPVVKTAVKPKTKKCGKGLVKKKGKCIKKKKSKKATKAKKSAHTNRRARS